MPTPSRETVIDGYNLIHMLWHPGREMHMAPLRERLEALLAAYRKKTRRHVTVVYDGGPRNRSISSSGVIEVVFSGSGTTADARIVDHVRALRSRAALVTVVTSDLEIRRHVIAWGAACTSSESFLDELGKLGVMAPKGSGNRKADKASALKNGLDPLSDGEVERWLKLFGGSG
jgi:uncharacterized protein